MLKSNNFNSVIDDLSAFSTFESVEALRPTTLELESTTLEPLATIEGLEVKHSETLSSKLNLNNNNDDDDAKLATKQESLESADAASMDTTPESSLASLQLTTGILQLYAPPIAKAKVQLRELIQKQNKIYIDLSTEKYKLDNAEVAKLQDMMNNVKLYREKLLKIKKQMQNIYQRTKVLKKTALNIQTCKEKELHRKLQKQQQEESLIGKQ